MTQYIQVQTGNEESYINNLSGETEEEYQASEISDQQINMCNLYYYYSLS